jgi:hypothetical protein
MNSINLRICGSDNSEVSVAELAAIKSPEKTATYQPIPHSDLVSIFRDNMRAADLTIKQELHTVSRFGQRYFGLFEIDLGKAGTAGTVVGLRNSHDKSFPAGICAGNAPFVCSNLVFHNEVVFTRRHTTNVLRDLPQIVGRAIGALSDMWTKHETRVSTYQGKELSDEEAGNLILRSYRAGAIGKTMIADVLDQWEKPAHEEFAPRNLWSLHNAFTEVYKGNLLALPKRSQALHSIFDPFAGLNLTVDIKPEVEVATV